jgi:hypothetical protein
MDCTYLFDFRFEGRMPILLVGLWYILITAAMYYPFGGCIINCLKYSSSASSVGKFNVA